MGSRVEAIWVRTPVVFYSQISIFLTSWHLLTAVGICYYFAMRKKEAPTSKGYRIKLRKQTNKLGGIQQKILLLLLGGFALSCTRSPGRQWRIIKDIHENWKQIDKRTAERAIASLYESRLIEERKNPDGATTLILCEEGKRRALTYQIQAMKIKRPKTWDKKWRVVIFDIPEDEREARDSLRGHLSRIGFYKLQQSVAVYPFDCRDEIDFLIELHGIRPYVRIMEAGYIDNEAHLKSFFGVS